MLHAVEDIALAFHILNFHNSEYSFGHVNRSQHS